MVKLSDKEWAKVDDIVEKTGCSIQDAIDMIQADKDIDSGKRVVFDLSPEDEKAAKKYANSTEKKKTVRQRAENPTKRAIIAEMFAVLEDIADNVAVTNPERMISFEIGDNKYEIMLTQKRKPKV